MDEIWSHDTMITGSIYSTLSLTIDRYNFLKFFFKTWNICVYFLRYLAVCAPFLRQKYNIKAIYFVVPITIFAIIFNVPRFYELEFDDTTRYFYNCRNNSETDNSTSSTDYDSFLILLSNIQKEVCTNYGVNVKGLRWNKIYQVVSLIWEIFIQIQWKV